MCSILCGIQGILLSLPVQSSMFTEVPPARQEAPFLQGMSVGLGFGIVGLGVGIGGPSDLNRVSGFVSFPRSWKQR